MHIQEVDKNQLSKGMKQYYDIKMEYLDAIVLNRMGDFYEMFFEDAEACSKVLDIALTGKDCGLEKRAPMCGIPFHACEPYIAKLLNNGYKVAVCEQLSVPNGKDLVKRGVVRVITPGTVIDSAFIPESLSNYCACIYKNKNNIGLSYIDITTGEFYLTEFTEDDAITQLNDTLVRIKPSEIICNKEMKEKEHLLHCAVTHYIPEFYVISENEFDIRCCEELLKKQLKVDSLKVFNCATRNFAIVSAGALINYVLETQKRELIHINKIEYVINNQFMQIDANTRRNLELTETNRDRKKMGSLFWMLDRTQTKMGQRLLATFINQPLFNDKKINHRLKGVEELVKNIYAREQLKSDLRNVYDIERLCGKISYNNFSPKECIHLRNSLSVIPYIKQSLTKFSSDILVTANNNINTFDDIIKLINDAIVEEPPMVLKDGGYIKPTYNAELNELVEISTKGKQIILELEAMEKEKTGIKSLKIKYNRIFGYFIEITNKEKDMVPYNYIKKQTVANAERFITEELKEVENKILTAHERRIQLEAEIFNGIRQTLLSKIFEIQETAKNIALVDALLSLSIIASEKNYVKPIIDKNSSVIEILDGRHPVVEVISKDEFVPNDTMLNNSDCRTMIITGPNMAGKSTYMRQVALITLMAHIGSFVPAKSAKIGLTDRIFTRVGASDDLAFGQSTFMVEMSEVSNILKNATNNSLIILDEVGRGTSTFDGLSIAWSVMEYVSKHLCAKTLFATHYHELTDLEGVLEGVKNYRINVKEFNNSIVFLRKIVRGGANKSFGIEVASLAGLPEEVISRAKVIMASLEQSQMNNNITNLKPTDSSVQKQNNCNKVLQILSDVNINTLTPLNAFDILVELKNQIKDE